MSDSNEETRRENEAEAEGFRLSRLSAVFARLAHHYEYMRRHAISDQEKKDIGLDARAAVRGLVEDWV